MPLYVLFLVCALFFYNVPVAQENANIESGKIMFRLVFQSDTLSFYYDSVTQWEKALQEMEFFYSDFYLENLEKKSLSLPRIQFSLFRETKNVVMSSVEWLCMGTSSCEMECIEEEINALWVNYKRSVP
ncbi:MAG: hypothetical protein RLZZ500_1041 [Bacteroidota bacterium]|jgi:hypothetical protein